MCGELPIVANRSKLVRWYGNWLQALAVIVWGEYSECTVLSFMGAGEVKLARCDEGGVVEGVLYRTI